jgi:hypothetical protein
LSQKERRPYGKLDKVQVLADPTAVSDCLHQGWVLLRIPDKTTTTIDGPKVYVITAPCFVLGMPAKEAKP